MDNTELSVRAILAGLAPKDESVTVRGWVRTRRDSKAGISFVHLSDVLGEPGQPVNADPSVALFNCLYIQRAMALVRLGRQREAMHDRNRHQVGRSKHHPT